MRDIHTLNLYIEVACDQQLAVPRETPLPLYGKLVELLHAFTLTARSRSFFFTREHTSWIY